MTNTTRTYQLRQEPETAQESLETTIEELQSANEELETTNEELQSTNEELETTNEELRATNEELEATNEMLRHQSDEAVYRRNPAQYQCRDDRARSGTESPFLELQQRECLGIALGGSD
jgi:peptidoglycan hydrolase CwlO-like protein